MFVERINHVTGEREWVVHDEDYDLAQELARSRFADMILDFDRNDMFLAGLKTVIDEKKGKGERVHVLDIGTGTGLLSLMAAREGADQVTALEVFDPMAKCATKITQKSAFKDKITVISSRSTDLSHLGQKPNVIVAEVFDTELNGEGALRTFKEALVNLVQPGCRVIPSLGRVWVQPVNSSFLKQFNRVPSLDHLYDEAGPLGGCPGTAAVFDVQLSRVDKAKFKALSQPVLAFEFDYENAESIIYDESFVREFKCTQSGNMDAIMMWWDLDMDRTGKNFINMAPSWMNEQFAWRDHWMQAVYYLPSEVSVLEGQTIQLNCSHDEFSMWFSVGKCSRQSVFSLNTLVDDEKFVNILRNKLEGKSVIVVGEGSLLGVVIAKFASRVTIVDSNPHFRSILKNYVKYYDLLDKVAVVESIKDEIEKPDFIVAEPFYLSAMNPWQNLRFWHEVEAIRKKFGENISVLPQRAELRYLSEKFTNLHTIASPVGTVDGFDLSFFDEISQKARQATDAIVDEQPLWEYGGTATSAVGTICAFDFSSPPTSFSVNTSIPTTEDANGIPMWMDWFYGDYVRTTGPVEQVALDEEPIWNVSVKQGVFLQPPHLLGKDSISLKLNYDAVTGDIIFNFH